jgi:hypothetical protein
MAGVPRKELLATYMDIDSARWTMLIELHKSKYSDFEEIVNDLNRMDVDHREDNLTEQL